MTAYYISTGICWTKVEYYWSS